MTATETMTDRNAESIGTDGASTVRWEPCGAFTDADPTAGVPGCEACGWLADDHESGGEADGAIVVTLPTRPVLRRAS